MTSVGAAAATRTRMPGAIVRAGVADDGDVAARRRPRRISASVSDDRADLDRQSVGAPVAHDQQARAAVLDAHGFARRQQHRRRCRAA